MYGSVRGASGNRRPYRDNEPERTRAVKALRKLRPLESVMFFGAVFGKMQNEPETNPRLFHSGRL
jgi:hypothetical protein